jgi:uncharacterized membrane protein required for colicin V production
MNILTIIILAVLVLSVIGGYKKGFLKTAFSLVAWIVVLILCNFVTPIVTDMLVEKTEIEVVVQKTVDTKIDQVINETITETIEGTDLAELEAALPAELKDALLGENGSLQEVVTNGVDLDTAGLVNGIVGILGFVITVIVLRLAMLVVELALNLVGKLPLIGPMDKILGLACGAGKGIILCWVILAVVSVLALTGTNTELATYISQSELLTWLQDNNVLLNLILDIQ